MPSIKKSYQHLKKAERLEIAILLEKSYSIRDIAKVLDRSPSSISEEIKKNKTKRGYHPFWADQKVKNRRRKSKYQTMKIAEDFDLRNYIEEKIKADWSPEEIAGRLKKIDWHLNSVSYKTIYRFVHHPNHKDDLEQHLRHYQKGIKRNPIAPPLEDRTFIDQRPEIIKEKQRFFDWEGDFIVSGKQGKESLLVLYERKSQIGVIRKVERKSPDLINQVFQKITGGRIYFNSLTLDNDLAFKKHQLLSKIIGAPIYFCHPYHSWEKGGVENFNKLIRQYIPKSSDISKFSETYIKEVENKLNNRPRKNLNYKTPIEFLKENNQINLFHPIKYFDIININYDKQKTAGCSA